MPQELIMTLANDCECVESGECLCEGNIDGCICECECIDCDIEYLSEPCACGSNCGCGSE